MREKENMGESREKIATLECEQRFIIKPNSNFFCHHIRTQVNKNPWVSYHLSLCMHFRYFFFVLTTFLLLQNSQGNYTNTNDQKKGTESRMLYVHENIKKPSFSFPLSHSLTGWNFSNFFFVCIKWVTWRRKERWCWWWWAWVFFRTSEGKQFSVHFFRHCTKNNALFLCVLSVYTQGTVWRKGKIEKSLAQVSPRNGKFLFNLKPIFLCDAQNAHTR